jgi:hypothetical protein
MPIQKLYIKPTNLTPEVNFSPAENIFVIRGISSPEDVRAMYYPVIEWIKNYIDDLLAENDNTFTSESPMKLRIDLMYFNSSTAKFLYDIFLEVKRLITVGSPYLIEWVYDEEDLDQKEAGSDIALLVGMSFSFIPKKSH